MRDLPPERVGYAPLFALAFATIIGLALWVCLAIVGDWIFEHGLRALFQALT